MKKGIQLICFCAATALALMFSGCATATFENEGIVTSEMTTDAQNNTSAVSEPVAETTVTSDETATEPYETTAPETTPEKQVAGCVLVSIFEVENLAGKDDLKADILSMLKGLERFRNLSKDTVMTMMNSTDESLSYDYMIYDSYVQQDIESLEGFWFPTADIEGFTLSYASIWKTEILYFYAPNDELMSDDFSYNFKNCIIIAINREFFGDNDLLDRIGLRNRDREYTERDGMIFTPGDNDVNVRLETTSFRLKTPKSITTDADTLFDLAARIRDSMELITLD